MCINMYNQYMMYVYIFLFLGFVVFKKIQNLYLHISFITIVITIVSFFMKIYKNHTYKNYIKDKIFEYL
jgi:uncharacterized membrane protein